MFQRLISGGKEGTSGPMTLLLVKTADNTPVDPDGIPEYANDTPDTTTMTVAADGLSVTVAPTGVPGRGCIRVVTCDVDKSEGVNNKTPSFEFTWTEDVNLALVPDFTAAAAVETPVESPAEAPAEPAAEAPAETTEAPAEAAVETPADSTDAAAADAPAEQA